MIWGSWNLFATSNRRRYYRYSRGRPECSWFVLCGIDAIGGTLLENYCAIARGEVDSAVHLSYDLDLKTLIWTRGAAFPISDPVSRLECPSRGLRRVALVFAERTTGRQNQEGGMTRCELGAIAAEKLAGRCGVAVRG
jgi:hypothetical protein